MEGKVWIGTDIGAISIQLVAFIRNAKNKRIFDSLNTKKSFILILVGLKRSNGSSSVLESIYPQIHRDV